MSSFWFQQFSSSPFFIDKGGDLIALFSSPYHKTYPCLVDASGATHCSVTISRTSLSVFVIRQSAWFNFSTNLILPDSQSLP